MDPQLEIVIIASIVGVACALPGVFLVLRRMALMSDAISHSILFGIVVAFFVTRDLSSPFLILAAAATGVLTVTMVELLVNTRRVKEDAAIGLVFPVLFSIGVILVSRFAGNVHLDTDAVLLGELAFAPLDRFVIAGTDLGPRSMWVMAGILLIDLFFIVAFFKELRLATFDAGLAAALGFSPTVVHYGLMSLVSITAVGAFDAVGSVLVVALMIAPPAAAYLLTDRLWLMMLLSAIGAVAAAIGGYALAHSLDASIAGSMATVAGVIFLLAYLFAPERGVVSILRRRRAQRLSFAARMLVVHLYQHEGIPGEESECAFDHLQEHLRWDLGHARTVVARATRNRLVEEHEGMLQLTDDGRKLARKAIVS